MECENAYYKDGIPYVLCRKEAEPDVLDKAGTCHAMCGFQRFCPNRRCCTLLPAWEGCRKRDMNKPHAPKKAAGAKKAKSKGNVT